MSFKERLQRYMSSKQEQMQRGREITMQMQAERARKRINRVDNMKPGAAKAIAEGLQCNLSPMDVMKKEYQRRKDVREHNRNDR